MTDPASDTPDERESPRGWRSRLPLGELPLESETTAFLLTAFLDILLTYLLLASGQFRESNAIADYFIAGWGVKGMVWFKMGLAAFICTLAQIIAKKNLRLGRFVLLLGTAVTGAVVIYSVTLALRHL
ncbi:DUF5658 family protein [Alienimonas californiensis]|uniref:DUF5658 domain-containing protein n=1 Tax=Alienimonas californiensis TaxID=2527989 RepID=A0A517PAR6_9PLAN|nr:DUF5658 family protein [Alienimonas californiensis]QDT16469.1 hypothetical protein CA12_25730 [Alienimonas californiensis]